MHVHNAQLFEALQTTNDSLERLVAERTRALADARDALEEKAARLSAVLSDMAQTGEQERFRIASDLHDSVNQLLIAAMLEVTSAQRRMDTGHHDEASRSLDSARGILSQVESEIRRVIYDLHPPVLDALGLAAATRDLADRFDAISSQRCSLRIEGEMRRLPARVELGLYRMLQEALHNACTHSGADSIDVSLTFGDGCVTVAVGDDGCGFDPATKEPLSKTGFGLENMRRRVEDLSGRFALSTRPGLGTHVMAWIPESGGV
jgi:signal transduction histidine kinase